MKITEYEKLEHLSKYISLRVDLISKSPSKWLGLWINQIFTFEYYIENCVIDSGGAYDFTRRLYKSRKLNLETFKTNQFTPLILNQKKVSRYLEFSMWMGTPFNEIEKNEIL